MGGILDIGEQGETQRPAVQQGDIGEVGIAVAEVIECLDTHALV
jgi:hypothetical protein